jgi:hypothetical protein
MSADTLSLDMLTGTVTASADYRALWLRHIARAKLAVLVAVGAPSHVLHRQRLGHRGKRPGDRRGRRRTGQSDRKAVIAVRQAPAKERPRALRTKGEEPDGRKGSPTKDQANQASRPR